MSKNFEKPVFNSYSLESKIPFKNLTSEELDFLDVHKNCETYKKGTVLYEEGSRLLGVYCISKGILKIYKTGIEGKEQIIRFAKAGEIIGYRSVINGEPACTSVKVLEDAVLCFINTQNLYQMLKQNNDFAIELLHITCKELGEANNYLTDIAQKTVRERLAEIIIKLKKDFGTDSDGKIRIILTREELANIIGTATESVIRLLSEFKNEKIIELAGRQIKIIDENKLKKISNVF